MGLGLYPQGSGISAACFCLERGAKLLVTDRKSKKELLPNIRALENLYGKLKKKGEKVTKPVYRLGSHKKEDFIDCDMVIRNPAVRLRSPYLQSALKNGIPVESDVSLFFKLFKGKIIGITGTRGKSTLSTLIYQILKNHYPDTVLRGNIGISPLYGFKAGKSDSLAVLELSSWLLESLDLHKLSPRIGVFSNLLEDHLDAYPDLKTYGQAKEAIFKHQNREDFMVLNQDNPYTRKCRDKVRSRLYLYTQQPRWARKKSFQGAYFQNNTFYFKKNPSSQQKIAVLQDLKIKGAHNISHVLAAIAVAKIMKVPPTKIRKTIQTFPGVPFRLEYRGTFQGVRFYNDTTASTPQATLAALETFQDKDLVLIAGGSEKNLDFGPLAQKLTRRVKALILFEDKASFRLEKEINKVLEKQNKKLPIEWAGSMKEAVKKARRQARKGDIVLLSPACASFGLFNNEFHRGELFNQAVNSLGAKHSNL